MLVWVSVIRYLGFFRKYNVRTFMKLRLPQLEIITAYQEELTTLFLTDLNLNLEGGIPKCGPILLLCGHDLPRVLFLWLGCARALP